MTFKDVLNDDLDVMFNTEEFAQHVEYRFGEDSLTVEAQVFDEESDMGDSMMRIVIVRIADIPNMSNTNSFFIIDGVRYGVVSFTPDEHHLLYTVLTQKAM